MKAKQNLYVDLHAWERNAVNLDGWLTNFETDDLEYATRLVNCLTYFSSEMCDQLLLASWERLSAYVSRAAKTALDAQTLWQEFLDKTVIITIIGEEENVTDSGNFIARRVRQLLRLNQSHVFGWNDGLKKIEQNPDLHVILVDDFVGTGGQLDSAFKRPLTIGSKSVTLASLARSNPATQFYLCLMASTETGLETISDIYPWLKVFPGTLISRQLSLVDDASELFTNSEKVEMLEFIKRYSQKIGYIAEDRTRNDWRGFGALGHIIAMSHSVPDCTFPIIHSEKNGWVPLVVRS